MYEHTNTLALNRHSLLYRAQLGDHDKSRAIKGLVVCNSLDVSAIGPTKRCYQPSPEVFISMNISIGKKFKNVT